MGSEVGGEEGEEEVAPAHGEAPQMWTLSKTRKSKQYLNSTEYTTIDYSLGVNNKKYIKDNLL